jgi:hypothetical protein
MIEFTKDNEIVSSKGGIILDLVKKINKLKNGDYRIVIEKKNKVKSRQLEKYYWKYVIGPISDLLGYEKDEVHEILLARHSTLPGEAGKPDRIVRTSNEKLFNTKYQMEYYAKIRRWASQGMPSVSGDDGTPELSISIPEPNEVPYK